MVSFSTIKSIDATNDTTWRNHMFLTIDIDWAHDDILEDTIALVEEYNIPVTWFVTHNTPLLKRLRENPNFELGIHPNFNPLLAGENAGVTYDNVLLEIMRIVPEAVSMRSHSTTQNSNILHRLTDYGITHESNCFIPVQSEIELKPWLLYNDLVRCPYFWEDDVACLYSDKRSLNQLKQSVGLKIFDFHPIHIFLNTENLALYESTRSLHRTPKLLKQKRFNGYGTRNKIIDLMTQT